MTQTFESIERWPLAPNQRLAAGKGFTLVELLVVVTIIVILLALLAPAMNKAVYEARLTACAAQLKSVGAAITIYAMENKRAYPDRGLEPIEPGTTLAGGWINPFSLSRPGEGWDNRPVLRKIMDINTLLQCPLNERVELVDTPADYTTDASYLMYWGWKYHTSQQQPGVSVDNQNQVSTSPGAPAQRFQTMKRLGDRFAWQTTSYSVLAGDMDMRYDPGSAQGSHPDRAPFLMAPFVGEGVFAFGRFGSASRYIGSGVGRGLVDTNFLFQDNAVAQYRDVPNLLPNRAWQQSQDDRFGLVPIQFDNRRDYDRLQIPRQ